MTLKKELNEEAREYCTDEGAELLIWTKILYLLQIELKICKI